MPETAPGQSGVTSKAAKLLGIDFHRQLDRWIDDHYDQVNRRRQITGGGLDPDIAALKSVSLSNKCRLQNERELEIEAVVSKAREWIRW